MSDSFVSSWESRTALAGTGAEVSAWAAPAPVVRDVPSTTTLQVPVEPALVGNELQASKSGFQSHPYRPVEMSATPETPPGRRRGPVPPGHVDEGVSPGGPPWP